MSWKFRSFSALFSRVCLFGLLLFVGVSAFAQSASVSGRVIDPSSAVVRGAQITFTNTAKGTSQTTRSNEDGFYSLPFVEPGAYTLTVEISGFKRFERTAITVTTAQSLVLDVRLQVGDVSQSVTVDGSGAHINTSDASVSTIIGRQFVENIPLNGRSFQSLETLSPGVAVVPSAYGVGLSGELSVNGQRTESNAFLVDGVSANTGSGTGWGGTTVWGAGFSGSTPSETVLGTTQSMTSLDDLEEFRAVTSTYSAEYGRTPGGQFTFQTRAGTSDFHGSAFDYLRNGALDANNWFNKYLDVPRPDEKQNDFGGTLGGPIWIPSIYNGRRKSFFFFSYEGLRLQLPVAAQTYDVPSLHTRQIVPDTFKPIVNSFPLPSANGTDLGDGMATYLASYSAPSSLNSTSIRIDHNFSDRFRIFGRYANTSSSSSSRYGDNLSILTPQSGRVQSLTLGSTYIMSPRIANDLRFNLTRNNYGVRYEFTDFGGATPLSLGSLPGFTDPSTDWLIYTIGLDNWTHVASEPQATRQTQINVTDATTMSVGSHSLKFGIDYRRLETGQTLPLLYEFGYTGDPAKLLTGTTDGASATFSQIPMKPIYMNFSAYGQDEWKATNRLSLSLGLRWDVNPPPTDAYGNNPYGITNTNLADVAVAPANTPLWKTTYGNFAPRVGLAYQVHTSPGAQTVLRAGYGLFYDTGNLSGSSGYNGFGQASFLEYDTASFPLAQAQVSPAPPIVTSSPYQSTVLAADPDLKLPRVSQWNVSLEQGLGENQTFTIGYVASAGRKLLMQRVLDPGLVGNENFSEGYGLWLTSNAGSSDYNSLQAKYQRKLSHGLEALVSYTWSHSFDNLSSNFEYVNSLQRASSDFDLRNNFQLAMVYNVPGNYQNPVARKLLSQWAFDTRITATSSLPVDILGAYSADVKQGATRYFHPQLVPGQPLYVSNPAVPGGRSINYKAFTTLTDDSGKPIDGNASRNLARGFDAVQADVAIRRDFHIVDRVGLQFRVEAFNLLNHPIFGAIYNQLSNGPLYFGNAYNTQNGSLGGLNPLYQIGGPRSLQAALKLRF